MPSSLTIATEGLLAPICIGEGGEAPCEEYEFALVDDGLIGRGNLVQ